MQTVGIALFALACAAFSVAAPAQDALRGESLYAARCAGCHSVDRNRIGPLHAGVLGRRAGSVAGYTYSPALARAKFFWNAKTLDRWLADPEGLVPGQKMGYSVAEARDRADLVAYLALLH